MESFKDQKWQAFVEKCKERVASDSKELGIDSVFVPQPEICPKPKYLILGTEPYMASKADMLRDIAKGYKGSAHYAIDYCAYKYLCGGKFEYQLVDFCKGAMAADADRNTRHNRYREWLPLLKEEWELLGRPKVIAVGKGIYNNINRLGFEIGNYILHYAGSANSHRAAEYKHFKLSPAGEEAKAEMRSVIREELLKKFYGYDRYLIAAFNKDHYIEIDSNHNGMAIYRHNFEELREKGEISHQNSPIGAKI